MSPARRYTPLTRLQELVSRAGGKLRERAVADANANVETIRQTCIDSLVAAIDELEHLQSVVENHDRWERKVLLLTDRIATVASHFKLERVRFVADELAALVLESGDEVSRDALGVYIAVMRLFAPGVSELSNAEARLMSEELSRVRSHLVRRIDLIGAEEIEEAATSADPQASSPTERQSDAT